MTAGRKTSIKKVGEGGNAQYYIIKPCLVNKVDEVAVELLLSPHLRELPRLRRQARPQLVLQVLLQQHFVPEHSIAGGSDTLADPGYIQRFIFCEIKCSWEGKK